MCFQTGADPCYVLSNLNKALPIPSLGTDTTQDFWGPVSHTRSATPSGEFLSISL